MKLTKQPLPKFEPIKLDEIPAASTLLFYGGNRLTEFVGNTLYKHPYTPPAFHAAFYIADGLFLNVGKFKTVEVLEKEFRSSRRIDVIRYHYINDEAKKRLCRAAVLDTSKMRVGISLPDYSFTDYLRFGLKFLKPSKKDFCSENVVELFKTEQVEVSGKKAVDTAPWTLLEFALAHPSVCEIRTLFVGPDFKG